MNEELKTIKSYCYDLDYKPNPMCLLITSIERSSELMKKNTGTSDLIGKLENAKNICTGYINASDNTDGRREGVFNDAKKELMEVLKVFQSRQV